MGKLIQICASQNDLFALDEEGDVFPVKLQYEDVGQARAEPVTRGKHMTVIGRAQHSQNGARRLSADCSSYS
jgi:hypothetical protein